MSYPTFNTITITQEGGLAIITINRESKLNALNQEVISELTHACATLEISDEIRVVAVTGAGAKAFVAGADIGAMVDLRPMEAQAFSAMGGALGESIERSENVWVAAVNGFAFGGGCELALACDFVYAADNAKFGQPEVKLGVIPGFGGTQRLARRVGIAKAKELCMTGDSIDAAEALRIGLCDAVFPQAELMGKVRSLAERISANGPLAVAEVKRLIQQGQSTTLEHALALEQRSFGLLFATEDQREGMRAFLDKRKPQFKGQ